jgi:HNH endonuclease
LRAVAGFRTVVISHRAHHPTTHGGKDSAENLALACHHCNLHKGTNLSGLDPKTRKLTRLFHPRLDDWNEHFKNREGEIIGLSAIGRTTVNLLRMNENGRLQLRTSAEQ